jgi:hypothetical protein
MKKILTIGTALLLLMASMAILVQAAQYVSPFPYAGSSIYTDPYRAGPHRFTDYDTRVHKPFRISKTVYLTPPGGHKPHEKGFAPYAPRGTARIYSSQARSYAVGEVIIKTKDLEPSYKRNMLREGWLYDSKTGYRTSMGKFKTIFGGVGSLTYNVKTYLDGYDYVIITEEPPIDLDPRPSETILLMGAINPQPQYVRSFGDTKETYGYLTSEASN